MEIGLLDFIAIVFSLALSLAIIVPLTGVLVRFRANYNPKGLQLDAEGNAQPYTGPVIQSYFGMMRRVLAIEGWSGLYKGLMPTLLSTSFITAIIVIFMDTPTTRNTHRKYSAPEAGVLGTLFYSLIVMLMNLPTSIITYRSITTPLRLPWFNAAKSLRVILTPTERRKPWILYLTPGLLAAEVSHIAIVVLGLGPLRRVLLPRDSDVFDISYIKLGTYMAILALSTAMLAPLEVIATRLAIQRNHASSEYNSVSQEIVGDAEDGGEFAGADEDVIGLRNEEDPYLGLMDCAQRIVNEEGWRALYRAWWITMLGTFAGVVSY